MMAAPVKKRLLLSAISNWLAFAAVLLVGFFLTPYMIRRLGDGPYGVWAFVESLLAYLTLFDLGIAACVVRYVARFHQTGEADRLRGLLSTTWFLFSGLAVGAFSLGNWRRRPDLNRRMEVLQTAEGDADDPKE